jgi:nitrogen fixation NifU-like protein
MYQERLIEHYKYSPYRGRLQSPSFVSDHHNPSCGDSVYLTGDIRDGKMAQLLFEGKGCVISQAAASFLCNLCSGKSLEELARYNAADMLQLVGIPLGPTRLRCALLVLDALHAGLTVYYRSSLHKKEGDDAESCKTYGADEASTP